MKKKFKNNRTDHLESNNVRKTWPRITVRKTWPRYRFRIYLFSENNNKAMKDFLYT